MAPALRSRAWLLLATSPLSLPYSEWYDAAPPALKPLIFPLLILILAFLFSFIGITASDFFCPNLSTIATFLGLSESTAGVTFLAFGNGSPDVFSTFAAMRGGTVGLAIGELIGAASFIVSIVVGSIALIRPFHVPRNAFLRDVIFFTSAVIVLVVVLHDGHLTLYESLSMVALYLAYVVVVVFGNWMAQRRRNSAKARIAATVDHHPPPSPPTAEAPPHPDEFTQSLSPLLAPRPPPRRARSHTSASHLHSHVHFPHQVESPYPVGDTPRANFSLLGAVEFRDVVNSLRKESETRASSPARSPRMVAEENGVDYFGPIAAYATHRRASSTQGFGHIGPGAEGSRGRSRPRVAPSRQGSGDYPSGPGADDTTRADEPNPWSDQPGRSTCGPPSPKPVLPKLHIPSSALPLSSNKHSPGIPSISITDPSGHAGLPPPPTPSPALAVPRESRFRIRRRSRMALRILFPSLQSFKHKSILGMFLAVVSVPAILALTVTLPVVDDGRQGEGGVALPVGEGEPLMEESGENVRDPEIGGMEGLRLEDGDDDPLLTPDVGENLHHLVESGFSPLHSPLGRIHHSALRRISESRLSSEIEGGDGGSEEGEGADGEDEISKELLEEIREEEALEFHKVLTAVQCVLGPTFCVGIVFQDMDDYFWWILLAAGLSGLIGAGLVLKMAKDGSSQTWRLVRCFAGFTCSMVWIAAIADEVVSVLGAVGEILGLSDAIIGLTIFAVGNSLADLVANVTVAQFAPAMAYAACFGGPMLNLLLGIGGSGTYHILSTPAHHPVKIHFSPTLWVSASGLILVLVATAIFVPYNGYMIDRKWAFTLIVAYLGLMGANIGVEIRTGRE